jgi:hypothetical protein
LTGVLELLGAKVEPARRELVTVLTKSDSSA